MSTGIGVLKGVLKSLLPVSKVSGSIRFLAELVSYFAERESSISDIEDAINNGLLQEKVDDIYSSVIAGTFI